MIQASRVTAILRGIGTNLIAMVSPDLFVKLTSETGRGGDCNKDEELEKYCLNVFSDYARMLQNSSQDLAQLIQGKVVVEYGPGDFLGVPLLFLCHGAKQVYCIDRFPLKDDTKYVSLYNTIIAKYGNQDLRHYKWADIINERIKYIVATDGLYSVPESADLIVSRAVLEHCGDLEKTYVDMNQNLKPGGIMIHKVDLTSHGTHLHVPLDFLTYSPLIWKLMTSQKGYPNRWRRKTYQELLDRFNYIILYDESRYDYSELELTAVIDSLAPCFQDLSKPELLCSDYFFTAQRK